MERTYNPELWELEEELGELEPELWTEEEAIYERPPRRGTGTVSFPPTVILPRNARRVTLRGFIRGSFRLPSGQGGLISAIANNIAQRHGTPNRVNRIRLVGHTDDGIRNLDRNLTLGHRRARNVRLVLQRFISLRTFTRSGFQMPAFEECSAGASRPVPGNPAANNRRVEVILNP